MKQTIFYVAHYEGQASDPISFILARMGEEHRESVTDWFTHHTGDVYVPVAKPGAEGASHGVVCVAPRAGCPVWKIYFTSDPMKQGEAFEGGSGPITNEDEAKSLASAMAGHGEDYAVFSFTPYAHGKPLVVWNPFTKGSSKAA